MSLLHIFLFLALSGFEFFSLRPLFIQSIHLHLGCPLFLFSYTSISIVPLSIWSLLSLLPKDLLGGFNYFHCFYNILISLLIFLILVTSTIQLSNIFFSGTASSPYIRASLTTLHSHWHPPIAYHTQNLPPVVSVTLNPKFHFFFNSHCLIYYWSQVVKCFLSL